MPTARPSAVTSAELLERLRRHYLKPGPMPGGVFAHEVGQNAGPNASRCDAIFVGFTSTSGRLFVGHEVKVSRSDWLAELRKPGKADTWADQCHAWWVVAPSTEVVKPEELPHGWGLMVPSASRTSMTKVVPALVNPDRIPAWWAVRSLLARLDTLGEAEISQRVHVATQREVKLALERERRYAAAGEERTMVLARRLAVELQGAPHYFADNDIVAGLRDLLTARGALSHVRQQAQWALTYLEPAHKALTDVLAGKEPPTDD